MAKKKNDKIGKVILIGGVGLLALFLLKGAKGEEQTGEGYANSDMLDLLNAIKETPPSVSFPSGSTFIFPNGSELDSLDSGSSGSSVLTKKEMSITEALTQPVFSGNQAPPLSPYKQTSSNWFTNLLGISGSQVNTSWKDTNSSMLDRNNTVENVFGDLTYSGNYSIDLGGSGTKKESNISTIDTNSTKAVISPFYSINTNNPKPVYLDTKKMANLQDQKNYKYYDPNNISINAGEATACQGSKCPI